MTDNKRSAISVSGLRVQLGANAKLGPLDLELAVGEHAACEAARADVLEPLRGRWAHVFWQVGVVA